MELKTEKQHLERNFIIYDRSHNPLNIQAINLTINTPNECRLNFQVSHDVYQQIINEAEFNLKPEFCLPLRTGAFQLEYPIEIEAILQPDLLPRLTEQTTDPEQTLAYLQTLPPDDPLLSSDNWFALHVKQNQESGEVGYRTFWSYVAPAVLTQDDPSSDQISEAFVEFFKDWADANLSEITDNAISEVLEEATQSLDEWFDTNGSALAADLLEELADTFDQWSDPTLFSSNKITASQSIIEQLLQFFNQDGWSFIKLKDQPILQTAFQGQHGTWNCFAQARADHQLIFYSLCPIPVPEDKRLSIAEFLTRANSGMILGNFELDFDDGEIRYKTSIDVTDDFLSQALIKQLVYANVSMMNEYLPGIQAVIAGEATPVEAIRKIEFPAEEASEEAVTETELLPVGE